MGLYTGFIIIALIISFIISIAILVWLHNTSLNIHRIYMLQAIDHLQTLQGVFIGANQELSTKLRRKLPNFIFIDKEQDSFDESIVENKDIVVVYLGVFPEEMSKKLRSFTDGVLKKHKVTNKVVINSSSLNATSLNAIIEEISDTDFLSS